MKKRIYLDYAAATPIDEKVAAKIVAVQKKCWANPSSLHYEGEVAKEILEKSRKEIAGILNCKSSEIYFTAGATEALNIAILGVVKGAFSRQNIPHIITSTIEHPAILETVKSSGAEISLVSPDKSGRINPETIKKEIKENTVLVCLAHANSEIGVVQPVRKIKEVIENCKLKIENSSKLCLLVDASQAACYENISAERLGADILILDGAKIHGPRGGILLVKKGVALSPILFGGGQEDGLRPGTENVAAAAGLSLALQIANGMREKESKRLTKLRDYAIAKILKEIPEPSLNGSLENRLPNNINICFPGQDSEFLVIKLDTLGFAVSAASACQNISGENSSYVLEAIGKKECSGSSLRVTLGRQTQKSDLDALIKTLKKITK